MSSASGLALTIRKAEESETFDLGGQNATTITNTIKAAFTDPLPLRDMIRLTFVTGAGKLGRQKYDEGAARAVTSTLRELGYEEDRGASCVVECAGSFKLQHDTGKNLKTVVVFPKISPPDTGDEAGGGGGGPAAHLVPPDCSAGQIARASPSVFKNMLKAKCPSWSQKKGCYAALERLSEMVAELDGKLMTGKPLDDAEQDFYDTTTGLEDKMAHCKEAIQQQVESGGITKFEKDILLEMNAERLATLSEEMTTAKGQKVEKLKTMKAKATQRKEMLRDLQPQPPHKLKHEVEIARLWKEAVPLLQVEEKCRGRLASVKETQQLARKDEVMEEIGQYEEASRGWFENDDAFDARVRMIRAHFLSKLKTNKGGKKATGSYASALAGGPAPSVARKTAGSSGGNNFAGSFGGGNVVPSAKNAWGNKKKNKTKGTGGGLFSAMMADDDSDDSDEEPQREAQRDTFYDNVDTNTHRKQPAAPTAPPTRQDDSSDEEDDVAPTPSNQQNESNNTPSNAPSKKKGKKKKKKGKGKKKDEADMSEDELLNSAAAANRAAKEAEEEAKEVSHPAIEFIKNYLIPFILSFIAFLVTLFWGKPKQKKK